MSLLDKRILPNVKAYSLTVVFACAATVLVSSQCDALQSDHFHCKLVDNCVCMFENGEGYDLTPLSAIKAGLNATVGNLTFYFHPCTDISIGNNSDLNHCYEGASICLYNHTSQSYINLGLSHEVEVISGGIRNPVAFVYTHNNSVTTIKMNKCDNSNSLEVGAVNILNKYELLLSSFSACRQPIYIKADPPPEPQASLSTGSVLVIMFIVFSSLYFVGGALVLKFARGAEGREMIPNYDFWVSLPGLVKEGFIFTMSGCSATQAYDRI